jgi:hypothetical protein
MFERKTIASFFLSLGLAVSPAPAQQSTQSEHHPGGTMPSQAMPGGTSMMGQDGMGGMPMMAAMTGHVEGRLAFLKTELKITDAQLPLWNTFAQAVRDNAKAMQDTMHGGMMGTSQSPSLPDKLAMREKAMTAHLEALRKLKTAVDPLYAALSIGIVASSHERPLPHIIAPVI